MQMFPLIDPTAKIQSFLAQAKQERVSRSPLSTYCFFCLLESHKIISWEPWAIMHNISPSGSQQRSMHDLQGQLSKFKYETQLSWSQTKISMKILFQACRLEWHKTQKCLLCESYFKLIYMIQTTDRWSLIPQRPLKLVDLNWRDCVLPPCTLVIWDELVKVLVKPNKFYTYKGHITGSWIAGGSIGLTVGRLGILGLTKFRES